MPRACERCGATVQSPYPEGQLCGGRIMLTLLFCSFPLFMTPVVLPPREYPPLARLEEAVRHKQNDLEAARNALTRERPEDLTRPYATLRLAECEAELAAAQARLTEARGEPRRAVAE